MKKMIKKKVFNIGAITSKEYFNSEGEILSNHYLRRDFILKVYGIYFILMVLLDFICFLTFYKSIYDLVKNTKVFLIIFFVNIALNLLNSYLLCFQFDSLKYPILTYLIYFITFLSHTYFYFYFCLIFNVQFIMGFISFQILAAFGRFIYLYNQEFDYDKCFVLLILYSGIPIFCLAPFALYWLDKIIFIIILIIMTMVYSLYLSYETKIIIEQIGRSYSEDDYYLAALTHFIGFFYIPFCFQKGRKYLNEI